MQKSLVPVIAMLSLIPVFWIFNWLAGRRLEEWGVTVPRELELVTTAPYAIPHEMITAVERTERDQPEIADNPPLEVGDECFFLGYHLVPGRDEPWSMLVVDSNVTHVVASWAGGGVEQILPRTVVRRYGSGGGRSKIAASLPSGDAGLAKALPRD